MSVLLGWWTSDSFQRLFVTFLGWKGKFESPGVCLISTQKPSMLQFGSDVLISLLGGSFHPIYKPFKRTFGRGPATPVRDLANHGYESLTSPGMILRLNGSPTEASWGCQRRSSFLGGSDWGICQMKYPPKPPPVEGSTIWATQKKNNIRYFPWNTGWFLQGSLYWLM